MGTQKNLIELNGKKYDTVTGKVISSSTSSVEGFMPSAHAAHHTAHQPVKHAGKSHTSGPAAKGIHHRATKSKTLMRGAVHRPPITAIQGTIDHIAQIHRNTHVVGDHKRAQRAKAVPKSAHIQRFGSGSDINGTFTSRTAVLPVKSAPETPKPTTSTAAKPVTTKAAAAATPVTKTAFTKELEKAQSHTQPKAPKSRIHHRAARKLHLKPRTLSLLAGTAIVVLLAGFFGYQYRAYASVKVAATRSGVNAALPASPAGFALSDTVHYKPGVVTLDYKSNTDGRNFTVTQANSNWNSEALAENFIAQLPPPHSSTLYPNGKTVFTYGSDGNNATWVSGGVWYKVEGNSALTSSQLQGIINSL